MQMRIYRYTKFTSRLAGTRYQAVVGSAYYFSFSLKGMQKKLRKQGVKVDLSQVEFTPGLLSSQMIGRMDGAEMWEV